MVDFLKRLQRSDEAGPITEIEPNQELRGSLADEYRELIMDQLTRGGIGAACVDLEIREAGQLRDGRAVFLGMLRLVCWERRSAVRLLLGLPILEAKVRRQAASSWLADVSHFGGLWLHASGQLQGTTALADLRNLVMDIEDRAMAGPSSEAGSLWSLPTDLGKLG